jgi:hypothetical protein
MSKPSVRVTTQLQFGFDADPDELPNATELERRLRALLNFGTPGQVIADKLCSVGAISVDAVSFTRSDQDDG